jgi:hypothetical protein
MKFLLILITIYSYVLPIKARVFVFISLKLIKRMLWMAKRMLGESMFALRGTKKPLVSQTRFAESDVRKDALMPKL